MILCDARRNIVEKRAKTTSECLMGKSKKTHRFMESQIDAGYLFGGVSQCSIHFQDQFEMNLTYDL